GHARPEQRLNAGYRARERSRRARDRVGGRRVAAVQRDETVGETGVAQSLRQSALRELNRVRLQRHRLEAERVGAPDVALEIAIERRLAAREDQLARAGRVQVLDPDDDLLGAVAAPGPILPAHAAVLVAVEAGADEPLCADAGNELAVERQRNADRQT